MTTGDTTTAARYFASIGYVDADPVRAKLCNLVDAGVIIHRLAADIGTRSANLSNIRRGRTKYVNPRLATVINTLDIDMAVERYSKEEPPVDEIQLERIIAGANVTLASHEKPPYARALHEHGWYKTQIARQLRMSGTAINAVLAGSGS